MTKAFALQKYGAEFSSLWNASTEHSFCCLEPLDPTPWMNDLSWPVVVYAWALSKMYEWWPVVSPLWACVRVPPLYSQHTTASMCESTPAAVWMLGSTATKSGSIQASTGEPSIAKGNGWAGGEKHCLCFFSSTDPYWVPGLLCGCGCPSHISPPLSFLPPTLPYLEAESDSFSPGTFSFASLSFL